MRKTVAAARHLLILAQRLSHPDDRAVMIATASPGLKWTFGTSALRSGNRLACPL